MPPWIWSTRSTTRLIMPAPYSLAIEEACRGSSPASTVHAARSTSQRAASNSVSESAIIHWIAWLVPIGLPNVSRVLAYSIAIDRARSAMPSACDGMRYRPLPIHFIPR